MRTLKHSFTMLLLLCIVSASFAEGERFLGKKVSFTNDALESSFTTYDVFQLDIQSINNYVKSFGDEAFELALVMDNQYFLEMSMMSYDIRGEDYRLIAGTEEGPVVLPRSETITYTGIMNNGDGKDIRMSVTDYAIMGFVYAGEEELYIEPLARLVDGAPQNYFITYRGYDILVDPSITCGKDLMDQHSAPVKEELRLQDADRSATLNCEEVDFAIAGAYDMYTKYGNSIANFEDHVLTITAMMETLYDDFDLDYIVRDIFLPTTSGSDPFPTTADVDVILPGFRTWGPTGFSASHDVAQLWVARNIFGCGSGTGLIGCAYIGTVCGGSRYNVCEDWSANFNCLSALSAHELGHNWDGVHSQATVSSHIMWPTIGCNNTTWSSGNTTRINNHINSRACLTGCSTACPSTYFLIDYIESGTWKYEASIWIISSGQITATANVTYDAASYVELREGFLSSPTGSGIFVARNDGCGGLITNPGTSPEPSAKDEIVEVETLSKIGFRAYPNPFSSQLTLEYEMEDAADVTITLHDAVGRELLRAVDEADVKEDGRYIKQINVSNLAAGTYFVTIVAGNEQMVEKVIKLD